MKRPQFSRRDFLSTATLAGTGMVIGQAATGRAGDADGSAQAASDPIVRPDFLAVPAGGHVYSSLQLARAATLEAGDVILIRDLAELAPADTWSETFVRGKWQAKPYMLEDGVKGRLLIINDRVDDQPAKAVPPTIEINLDLPGWYAIWIGVPKIDLRPRASGPGGVDVALDKEEAFVWVQPEYGTRRGKFLGPYDVEMMCYWKCALLEGRQLRLRVSNGTFASYPWGVIRGSICALRLVKLSPSQIESYERDMANPATKRTIAMYDGFSHYFSFGEPGGDVDTRFIQAHRNTDTRAIFFQTASTCCTTWPSRLTSYLGQIAPSQGPEARQGDPSRALLWPWTEEDRSDTTIRKGDLRAADYVDWAVKNKRESLRVLSELARPAGLELHVSLRMNLLFAGQPYAFGRMINGQFWKDRSDLWKPGGQLNYGKPEARKFVVDLLSEAVENYDLDGINLDFTRWPPIAWPEQHDFTVLTGLVREMGEAVDRLTTQKKRKIQLSANVADGFRGDLSLVQQKVDLEAWLASGALDFVCVEAVEHTPYIALARRYRTPYYALQDNDPPRGEGSSPHWEPGHDPFDGKHPWVIGKDPLPGEEIETEPYVNDTLDPLEWQKIALDRQTEGADGILFANHPDWRSSNRLGHLEEMAQLAAKKQIWSQEVGQSIRVG